MLEPIDIEEALGGSMTPEQIQIVRDTYAEAMGRVEESVVNFKFIEQMLGGEKRMPSDELLAVLISNSYMKSMAEWTLGSHPSLPMVFAILTVREVKRRA